MLHVSIHVVLTSSFHYYHCLRLRKQSQPNRSPPLFLIAYLGINILRDVACIYSCCFDIIVPLLYYDKSLQLMVWYHEYVQLSRSLCKYSVVCYFMFLIFQNATIYNAWPFLTLWSYLFLWNDCILVTADIVTYDTIIML